MFFLRIFTVCCLLTVGFSAIAADSSSGCGAGWYVFKENSLVSSSLRASTNATFLNTFGMTSGTSNCAQHSIVKADMRGIHYTEANFHNLIIEMASGKGEFLDGLAEVVGCTDKGFNSSVKSNFVNIYSSDDISASDLFLNIKNYSNCGKTVI